MKPINEQKIAICCDHAGYDLKQIVIKHLKENNVLAIKDFGAYSAESSDYADYAHPMALAVESQRI